MSRSLVITTKVQTRFGSLYVHASYTRGKVTDVSFSSPGKFADTTMGEVLDKLADAINETIELVGI